MKSPLALIDRLARWWINRREPPPVVPDWAKDMPIKNGPADWLIGFAAASWQWDEWNPEEKNTDKGSVHRLASELMQDCPDACRTVALAMIRRTTAWRTRHYGRMPDLPPYRPEKWEPDYQEFIAPYEAWAKRRQLQQGASK